MDHPLFDKYRAAIQVFAGNPMSPDLLLAQDGPLSVFYSPFEWVNPTAKVVLVGITPGKTQAINALAEARNQLASGASDERALQMARLTAAFSGDMRPYLVDLLDHIGLARWLRISSCSELFGSANGLLQTASALQYPVFLDGQNYNGTPDMLRTPLLRGLLLEHFAKLASSLPEAVFIPLGPVATSAVLWLADKGVLMPQRVLPGLPHPSTQNSERVKYFLGRKSKDALSAKTNAKKLDDARELLRAKVSAL